MTIDHRLRQLESQARRLANLPPPAARPDRTLVTTYHSVSADGTPLKIELYYVDRSLVHAEDK